MDELNGRRITIEQGMLVTGTLGVLADAAGRGFLSLPDAIARLRQTSFRYPKRLVDRLLDEDASRAQVP